MSEADFIPNAYYYPEGHLPKYPKIPVIVLGEVDKPPYGRLQILTENGDILTTFATQVDFIET